MKPVRLLLLISLACAGLCSLLTLWPGFRVYADAGDKTLKNWQVMWIGPKEAALASPPAEGSWLTSTPERPLTAIPEGSAGMWVHLVVPPTSGWQIPGLLADRLYGLDIAVYEGTRLLYESKRDFMFERNKLLLPLDSSEEPADLYIRILSVKQAGPAEAIRIGEYEPLSQRFVREGLPDFLFGTAIAFLGLIMSVCSGYLNRRQRGSWVSLCLIALSTGILIAAYSQPPYLYFEEYGNLFLFLFDLSLVVLFPALNAYVGRVFDGRFPLYVKFSKLQAGYSAFCLPVIAWHYTTGERNFALYDFFTNTVLGPLVLLQMLLIVVLAVVYAVRGSKDSLILTAGIFSLALSGALDLTFFYLSEERYVLILWKIGVALMIFSLVIILARRISADYSKLVSHSRELEMYNHRLQRTEKMKIISDLAASVAHEVRNPLQVTRGFLQLLAQKSDSANERYYHMAINELDRASTIITDFLTFAKPELDTVERINLSEEMNQVVTIIHPLAAMHGGDLHIEIEENLYIEGNASKFKQAVINILKNSIEALPPDGRIEIEAYAGEREVTIRIADNGEGMEEEQLARLGEPFFSTKTKGTGLGLMVTFRIIEAMKGTLEFRSEVGKGTEAIVRFPLAEENLVPDRIRA
ncbi:hypothetical protein J19TS2_37000 [Cohnella xylanilytica]|uniref:histidine kinase n=1 Tax=Cohnella xylanilytica TaxID=557555 RepID=A0A841U214_9BACL|nr:HAMP domain-containing sensor histidine kinase [Cohnella xylanilytica]MBB6693809.1 HAMP domain-containing histidine kinase [Cohnella xylanilytica]GIO14145.1 hypothetical protein J19TS2_37000 [Cohnella xylanilytica]